MTDHTSIIVADDHLLFSAGMVSLLKAFGFDDVREAADGEALFERIREKVPDVILLDIEMPVMNGHRAMKALAGQFPGIAVIVISSYGDDCITNDFLLAGAVAVFKKNTDITTIVKAIHHYKNVTRNLKKEIKSLFTNREREVLHLLCLGLTNSEIAKVIHLSEKTIENHRDHLYKKTNSHNSAQFFKFVYKNGLDQLSGGRT